MYSNSIINVRRSVVLCLFVCFCFVLLIFVCLYDCASSTGEIVQLPQCQWSNLGRKGKVKLKQKHYTTRLLCTILWKKPFTLYWVRKDHCWKWNHCFRIQILAVVDIISNFFAFIVRPLETYVFHQVIVNTVSSLYPWDFPVWLYSNGVTFNIWYSKPMDQPSIRMEHGAQCNFFIYIHPNSTDIQLWLGNLVYRKTSRRIWDFASLLYIKRSQNIDFNISRVWRNWAISPYTPA